ncbi:transposase [Streptomyces sp. NPDC001312]|uniref:transposase n=1 Tax=Streptomyces sp. NPDC001312 TaxID=3364561 RepID=UPI00367D8F65
MIFRTRTSCAWRDLPACDGTWKTVRNRHRRWSLDGTWERFLDGSCAGCDETEGEDWTVGVDSTVVRARQHVAGARHAEGADSRPHRPTGSRFSSVDRASLRPFLRR